MSDQKETPENGTAEGQNFTIDITNIINDVEEAMGDFIELENVESNMNGTQRRRLISAGVRNWGFIDKSYDISRDNPGFMPANFSSYNMGQAVRELEEVRQLAFTLEQFSQAVNECLLIRGDACYRLALRVYGSLREQARNKVPGAQALFQALLAFFRRRRRPGQTESDAEPTEKELERDFHRLLHGTADGKLEIINERPHASAGIHEAADEVNTGHAAVKETAEARIGESN
jgi:hypothetical protein